MWIIQPTLRLEKLYDSPRHLLPLYTTIHAVIFKIMILPMNTLSLIYFSNQNDIYRTGQKYITTSEHYRQNFKI